MNAVELGELVSLVQAGDRDAFHQLFERYKNEALRTACLITGNQASGEDIVQEAFVQVFLKIKTLKKPEQFRSWFYKILTHIAWRWHKREKKMVPVQDIYEEANYNQVGQALDHYMQSETSALLYEEIKKLEQKQKAAVVLYYFNGFTIAEIAAISGCLEGTVKSRLYTARKNLLKNLDEHQLSKGGCVGYEQ